MEHAPVPFRSEHFSLQSLADGVFAAVASDGGAAIANAGILDLGGRTLIYDTFMTPQAARDLLAAARQVTGREPDLIVNSHYHNDHIWGNQVFPAQTHIISSAQTLQLIQTSGREELQSARQDSSAQLAQYRKRYAAAPEGRERHELALWMRYYQALVDNLPDLQVRLPDLTFDRRLAIHGSSRSVELIPFEQAHCGHDAALFLRQEGILFAADLLFVGYHPFLAEGNPDKLAEALHQLGALNAAALVPGHGPVGSNQDLALNLEYLSMCVDLAKRLAAEGDTSPERIARERLPEPYALWEMPRFFSINLRALAARFARS